ncbi:hypothetical protein A2U01_0077075, partial [Trifolium medium]|nr:hypothetical protein [Trifolium medium]
ALTLTCEQYHHEISNQNFNLNAIMLKKVLGKGKRKRSTRGTTSGEGGSRQQPPQPPQEQQEGLSYAVSLVANYPYLAAYQHPWSDRFYREECK